MKFSANSIKNLGPGVLHIRLYYSFWLLSTNVPAFVFASQFKHQRATPSGFPPPNQPKTARLLCLIHTWANCLSVHGSLFPNRFSQTPTFTSVWNSYQSSHLTERSAYVTLSRFCKVNMHPASIPVAPSTIYENIYLFIFWHHHTKASSA